MSIEKLKSSFFKNWTDSGVISVDEGKDKSFFSARTFASSMQVELLRSPVCQFLPSFPRNLSGPVVFLYVSPLCPL